MAKIKFRPHHFMCTLGFQGKGYSAPFIQNYQKIVDRLQENPFTLIEVKNKLDSICSHCPHKTEEKLCVQQTKIEQLDMAHQNCLGFEEGQIISWAAAKKRIQERMSLENFHRVCEGCEWKSYGMCEEALIKLHAGIE